MNVQLPQNLKYHCSCPFQEEPMGIFDQEFHVLQPRRAVPQAATPEGALELKKCRRYVTRQTQTPHGKGGNRHGMHGHWKLS